MYTYNLVVVLYIRNLLLVLRTHIHAGSHSTDIGYWHSVDTHFGAKIVLLEGRVTYPDQNPYTMVYFPLFILAVGH